MFSTELGDTVWTCVSVPVKLCGLLHRYGHSTANMGHKCSWCARLELYKTINFVGKRPGKTFDFGRYCFLLQLKLCAFLGKTWE